MKYKILLLCLLLLNVLTNKVFAESAYPYPITIIQPDSTELTIQLVGDEFFHYSQTTDGLLIKTNDKGIYEYAELNTNSELILSGIKVNEITKRTTEEDEYTKKLKEKKVKEKWLETQKEKIANKIEENTLQTTLLSATPVTGTKKMLCILIGFQDKTFSKTQSNFDNLMNQTGYNNIGSVKDFYKENSYNQLNLNITVVGPYIADHNMDFYGANDSGGDDVNPRALIREALQKANPHVNYADYDNDGDGKVDGVHVIYAGYSESSGGPSYSIWPHKSSISPSLTLDGKSISKYSCSSELRGGSGSTICGIGTACHEMGHIFGAMDFYDTNYDETGDGRFSGTGDWDLMASGSHNSNGDRPAHFNPYTKTTTFQWATVKNITPNQQTTLYPANSNSNSFYKIISSTANEYFLIENRQKLGFDAGLPGAGMLVYHVHSLFNGSSQTSNVTHPQRFYPICASSTQNPNTDPSTYGSINSAGCPFPGSSNKTTLTRQSMPSFKTWAGNGTGFDIKSISKSGNNITFIAQPYFSISGQSTVCSTYASTYRINDLPPGTTINWTYSSNLYAYYGGSDFIALKSNGNGLGWVAAKITNSSFGTITVPTITVWAGAPTAYSFYVEVNGKEVKYYDAALICPNATSCLDARIAGFEEMGETSYAWHLPSWYWWQGNFGSHGICFNPNGTIGSTITADVTNSCGTGYGVLQIYFGNGGCSQSYSYIVSPNPASSVLKVEQFTADEAVGRTVLKPAEEYELLDTEEVDNGTYTVEIWHEKKGKLKTVTSKNKEETIDVSGLEKGNYILHIRTKQALYKEHLLVK